MATSTKITTNEIRRGNYLQRKSDGLIVTVDEVYESRILYSNKYLKIKKVSASIDAFQPIPLSFKWMVAFEILSFEDELNYLSIDVFDAEGFRGVSFCDFELMIDVKKIKTVHGLQNLLYVNTGVELGMISKLKKELFMSTVSVDETLTLEIEKTNNETL